MTAPEQLALPNIPPPPFAPRWPGIYTIDHTALEMFLAGEFVGVERFRQTTDSTRLPAAAPPERPWLANRGGHRSRAFSPPP